VKMFDADKTRMVGIPFGEKNYDNVLRRFHLIPERHGQTDGRTDGHVHQYRASARVLTRDKNENAVKRRDLLTHQYCLPSAIFPYL